MRQGRVYWASPESQFYAEPKRLAAAGYLEAAKQPRPHPRAHALHAHPTGRDALKAWLATPTRFPRIQNEAVVRLLGSEYADRGELLKSLNALREDLDVLDAELAAAERREAICRTAQAALRLNRRLAQRIVDAHRSWLERGRSRALKVPLQRFRCNRASVDSRIGAVSLSRGGPVR